MYHMWVQGPTSQVQLPEAYVEKIIKRAFEKTKKYMISFKMFSSSEKKQDILIARSKPVYKNYVE